MFASLIRLILQGPVVTYQKESSGIIIGINVEFKILAKRIFSCKRHSSSEQTLVVALSCIWVPVAVRSPEWSGPIYLFFLYSFHLPLGTLIFSLILSYASRP